MMPRLPKPTTISLCSLGLVLGTLFFAASLTPSLVPRPPVLQGALSGLCLGAGYGLGVLLRRIWLALQLPTPNARATQLVRAATLATSIVAAIVMLWWATGWQNRLRHLMELPAIDSAGPLTIAATALAVFFILILLARLFRVITTRLNHWMTRHVPAPIAILSAVALTAALFWTIGNGVLVRGGMHFLDGLYSELDSYQDETSASPVDPLKTGGPGSLLAWHQLGSKGRTMIAAGPDRQAIMNATQAAALEPLRVYVGLNSAPNPRARAQLALEELIRIGAFDRTNLVIATPTGTGWIDPESQAALEYVLHGDVATVSVQYSYLASWIALLADPDYGAETSREVFATIYDHWRNLPQAQRPKLYLHGLSLGALNSVLSHDLHQVIATPYQGALWSGPPFNTPNWRHISADRNHGSPYWLPRFRDGSVVRFTAQANTIDQADAPWGSYRILFLQYASDAVTFFDPHALWRRPDWMTPPLGPDVSPDMRWIPIVSFMQLAFDMMVAVAPPKGYGHVYAFDHYVDAWAALTDAPGWDTEHLDALKRAVRASTGP